MSKLSKRMQLIANSIDQKKLYDSREAFDTLISLSKVGFLESIDVSIKLNVDPRKSNEVVRGFSILPNGTGKKIKIAVFSKSNGIESLGSDIVLLSDSDLIKIKNGHIDFDVLVTTHESMSRISQIGSVLGPRGLMPSIKTGTITDDLRNTIENFRKGQISYRVDKNGIIHGSIGNIKFSPTDLKVNLEYLISDLIKLKPSTSKGRYIEKLAVSSTMGPGLSVDMSTLTF